MHSKLLIIIITLCSFNFSMAQIDSLSVAKFSTVSINRSIEFQPQLPPLQQIAGAPVAFYSYFWELGDGRYSKEAEPKHTYPKKGNYKVRLWATNNYGIERPPATRPQEISVDEASIETEDELDILDDIELERNHEPMPGEEMLFMLRYKNSKQYVTNGKIYLFYNEKKYSKPNFEIKEGRFYNGEQWAENEGISYTYKKNLSHTQLATNDNEISAFLTIENDSVNKTDLPATILKAKEKYKQFKQINFEEMNPGEKRNAFFTLFTPPEMIKDTSAIISIRGIYVPDSKYDDHKVKDMEMEIVTSHDPNKMSTSNTFINYRIARFKRIKYKIKFQNNGEGPARTIRLETDIPDMFDKTTIEVNKSYPKCPICPKGKEVRYSCLDTTFTEKQAIFTFKNIYLPGSEQKNVKDYDSTKGFVKYSLKFKKDFKKKKTKSRTAIIFDKNEPIITNYSSTRFVPGISIEPKVGYNYFPNKNNSKSYFTGISISPYKSYRFYLQAEFLGNASFFDEGTITSEEDTIHTTETTTQIPNPNDPDAPITIPFFINRRALQKVTGETKTTNYTASIPILLRYNLNNYIGIGTGVQADVLVSQKKEINLNTTFEDIRDNAILENNQEQFIEKKTFNKVTPSLLLDVTLGIARIGPSVGIRYINSFEKETNYWQLYARWKF